MTPTPQDPESPAPIYSTREEWLQAAVKRLAKLAVLDACPVPHVSIGFPSRSALSRRKKRLGECWHPKASEDGHSHIFITPLEADPVAVLAILLHELGHVKYPDAKHGAPFKRFMKLVGLEGKATATVPSPQCKLTLASIAADLGTFPHPRLNAAESGRKKQGTRLLKASCPACDCVVRITRQWAGESGETLPFCGFCAVDGDAATRERMQLA